MNPADLQHRLPLVDAAGRRRLQFVLEHPSAPRYTHPGFDRMTPAGRQRATDYAAQIQAEPPRWRPGQLPPWVDAFVETCYRTVPFYRRYGDRPAQFADIPLAARADLGREPWAFVPDGQALADLIVYNTAGTTGHPLDVLTHPDALGLYLPLVQAALAAHGVVWPTEPERVALALVCFQKYTYTYATVSAWLNQAGFVKVNLNPAEWRAPADRARFLDACQPEVFSGDPLAFAELAALPLAARPKALVSTAMTLTSGLQQTLAARFACPVLDLYSLNESGPLAVAVAGGYRLLQPQLYVEILDAEGGACPPGQRGEVVLTGGFNPFLPLLRYRTGDCAALEFRGGQPLLAGLEGRPPVVFRAPDGRPVNNVDVSIALRPWPIPQFVLHQAADGVLQLKVQGAEAYRAEIRAALLDLFGAGQKLEIETLADLGAAGGKLVQYTSALNP